MISDSIADFLTVIRNASLARKRMVEVPSSKMRAGIARILFEKGLKYHPSTKTPAIHQIDRISTPGLRQYADTENLPRVMNGLGIAIMSTSKGLMTDKEARKENVGGEVICFIS